MILNGVVQVHLRRVRGKLVVQTKGQTPRGKSFLKQEITLPAKRTDSPTFKSDLTAAIEELLAQQELPFP